MSKTKFYVCAHCGNIVSLIHHGGGKLVCCGSPMKELIPGEVEASVEKHLPVVKVENGSVNAFVGETEHPMTDAHSIQWIYLETDKGGSLKYTASGEIPEATFALNGDTPVAVYAYCNLHGLWMK